MKKPKIEYVKYEERGFTKNAIVNNRFWVMFLDEKGKLRETSKVITKIKLIKDNNDVPCCAIIFDDNSCLNIYKITEVYYK